MIWVDEESIDTSYMCTIGYSEITHCNPNSAAKWMAWIKAIGGLQGVDDTRTGCKRLCLISINSTT